MQAVISQLSNTFKIAPSNAEQIINLLSDGNTVPFIARYRKQETGDLDDQTLRKFETEWQRLLNLKERKNEVLRLITERGKLTPELEAKIIAASNLAAVEDLYRPYKIKKQTRASKAIEQGLQPLADYMLSINATEQGLSERAQAFLAKVDIPELKSVESVIQGGLDILAEDLSDKPDVRRGLRKLLLKQGLIQTKQKTDSDSVYRMYYDYQEKIETMEAHRWLAIQRGEREGFLRVSLICPDSQIVSLLSRWYIPEHSKLYSRLFAMCEDSWKRLLFPSLRNDLFKMKSEIAEDESIEMFAKNLRNLLLQPPIKDCNILGWDPGYTHGCKLALIDQRGEVVEINTIYPFESKQDSLLAEQQLSAMLSEHRIDIVAIGNGTASRESELWIAEFVERHKLNLKWLIVSEAGASVYSASQVAAEEFPAMDVNLRSAVSIARRVQDPLAELVKIEPKAIGVGQYQHDLNEKKLEKALADVVEDCVNQVGVDLNTASPHVLSYVAGLTPRIAAEIVATRKELSGFTSREQLKQVKFLGPKTFEQAAGFLRISDAALFLDQTAVHPESYEVTQNMADYFNLPVSSELGQRLAEQDEAEICESFALDVFTLREIIASLLKPNRDPRENFAQPVLKSDILKGSDLKPGMVLDGVVRNVVAFGAFVDVGIEHDGLVHVSKMADHYVKDPFKIVAVGQNVKVEVESYDPKSQRLALSMKLKNEANTK
ncbi:MAG: helix-hairpin-helix domain-containing protein [Saccharofermentanales bacterium]